MQDGGARMSKSRPMADVARPITPGQAAKLLLAIQATDAVACAIPLAAIREDLERLGCPPWLQRTIPALKGASVLGLLAGRRYAGLGRLTTDAVVAYFGCALGAHARVRDPAWRWAAATGMLGLALVARRAYPRTDVVDLPPGDEVIDLISEPTAPHLDADERLAAPASTTR